jgi:O-antigen/teichoic acid export membrane protein
VDEPSSSISRAFAWTFLGRMLYSMCQWCTLIVLAKLGGTVLVGRFALALAVTAPLSVFANLQLRSIYATDVRDEFSWATYWRLRIVSSASCLVLLAVVAATSESLRDDAWTIILVAAAKSVEMVEDLLYGVFQRRQAMHYFGRSLALRGVLGLFGVTVTLAAGLPLPAGMAAMLVAWTAVLVLYDAPRAKRLRLPAAGLACAPRDRGARLLWLALPMGAVMLLDSLNQNIPRYLIEWLDGTSELGLYVAMVYVIQLGGAVIFALGAPLVSTLARDHAAHRGASFTRRTLGLLVATAGFGLAGVLFALLAGAPFLRLAYSERFAVATDVFVWVMIGAAFHYLILMCNNVLTATRMLRVQPVIWAAALSTTTLASWGLVPTHGILGAAQAFTVGVAVGATIAIATVAAVIHTIRRREHAG